MVILNGTSSAGKSSIARRFRDDRAAAGECWLVIALDDFNDLLPFQWVRAGGHDGAFSDDGLTIEPQAEPPVVRLGALGRRLFAAYRRTAAAWAHAGFDVLVDDVCFDEQCVRDWEDALNGLRVTWVALSCDPQVAAARELARGDRLVGLAGALGDVVHKYAPCDAEIDTTDSDVQESAARLSVIVATPQT